MRVLGIESSCDETGLAVYDGKAGVLGEVLHSQAVLHSAYGGVVPELASRDHIRQISPLLAALLKQTNLSLTDIDAIAYTAGPGLVGALLVGATFARALAVAQTIPSLAINHLEAHLLTGLLIKPAPEFPFLALLVSGGHTLLVRADGIGQYVVLGRSCDDAAGECFDKIATLLGLTYPGGAKLARLAEEGNPKAIHFPRPMTAHNASLDFSFSGLKTSVAEWIAQHCNEKVDKDLPTQLRSDIAASFQEAVVDTIVWKCVRALKITGLTNLMIAGGVAANSRLRILLDTALSDINVDLFCPQPALCTDNGVMIAHAGWQRFNHQHHADVPNAAIEVFPRWPIEQPHAPI